jgi:hypothetical protein
MLRESGFNNKPIAMVSIKQRALPKNEIITVFYIVFDNFVYSLVSNTIVKMNSGSLANSLAKACFTSYEWVTKVTNEGFNF